MAKNPDMSSSIPSSNPSPGGKVQAKVAVEGGAARTTDVQPNVPASNPPRGKAQAEITMGRKRARTTHDQPRASREDGKHRKFAEFSARNDNKSLRATDNQPSHQHHDGHGSNSGQPSRQNAGPKHSIEKSPVLHPHDQAKARKAGGGSSAPVEKNSYDSSHGSTPGRTQLKPVTRADHESPHRDASVPRFDQWDENNPEPVDFFSRFRCRMVELDADNELTDEWFPFSKKSKKSSEGKVDNEPNPKPEEFGISTSDALSRNPDIVLKAFPCNASTKQTKCIDNN